MLTIISAIIVFSLLIGIHEAGHLIAAKSVGVTVFEFAIGMGPKLFSFDKGGTKYSLRLFPIGGYCKMDGEDESSENKNALCNKSVWQKLLVIASGALMNVLLGFAIYLILNSFYAGSVRINTVGYVVENSPAYQAGLQVGDKITKINNTRVHIPADVSFELFTTGNKPIYITIKRHGEKMVKTLTPALYIEQYKDENGKVQGGFFADNSTSQELKDKYGRYIIGYDFTEAKKTFFNVLQTSYYYSMYTVKVVFFSLKMLVTGQVGLNDVSGPVGIVNQIGSSAATGLASLLSLTALITINLGIFNLLPIPALDGGRIFFLLVELIRRKPIPPEKEGVVHFIGLALLMIFMLVVTANDIFKLITG